MNKNVNTVFLVLIVAVVLLVTGGTVYFQNEFYKLTGRYDVRTKELSNTTQLLERYKQLYSEVTDSLNRTIQLTEKEKSDLRQVYTITKTDLETDIAGLNSTLLSTQQTLEDTQQQLLTTSNQLTQKTNELSVANALVNSLEREKDQLNSRINELEAQLGECG